MKKGRQRIDTQLPCGIQQALPLAQRHNSHVTAPHTRCALWCYTHRTTLLSARPATYTRGTAAQVVEQNRQGRARNAYRSTADRLGKRFRRLFSAWTCTNVACFGLCSSSASPPAAHVSAHAQASKQRALPHRDREHGDSEDALTYQPLLPPLYWGSEPLEAGSQL